MASRKPKGWGDWNPAGSILRKSQKTSKGAISPKSLKTAQSIGRGTKKAAIEIAIGDPKAGPASIAFNAATWAIPYSKGTKVINAAVKGKKYVKTAKVTRGALKTAGMYGTIKTTDKIGAKVAKKPTRGRVSSKPRPRGK